MIETLALHGGVLRPLQIQTLEAAVACNGVICAGRMGIGKTLLSALLPVVLKAKRTIIVVSGKGDTFVKTQEAFRLYRRDWRIVETYKLVTYERLSRVDGQAILDQWQPDLIIADEAQNLRRVMHNKAAKKIARWMAAHQECMFCALTATLMKYGLEDYAHFFAWAFKGRSPLPLVHEDIQLWARAAAGDDEAIQRVKLTPDQIATRLRGHPGFIISDDVFQGVKLTVEPWFVEPGLTKELKAIRRDMVKPDGSPLVLGDDEDDTPGAQSVAAVRRQVGLGFYYVPAPSPSAAYIKARKAYYGLVNGVLSSGLYDSELEVRAALRSGQLKGRGALTAWEAVKDFKYTPVPVWLGHDVIDECIRWGQQGGIIWVAHTAFGEELARRTGWSYYGSGGKDQKNRSILRATGKTIICSQRAIAVGHHLIRWHRNLVVNCPSNSADLEQLIGRTFRDEQEHDVHVDILVTTEEHMNAFDKALQLATLEERQLKRRTVLGLVL